MRESYIGFPPETRKQIKKEQGFACAWCGQKGCLQVHHIVPQSIAKELGWNDRQITDRSNGVALCEGEGKCHETFDILALEYNRFFDEVAMDEGKEYTIPKGPRRNTDSSQVRDIVRFTHR